jgi:separase
VGCSLLSVHAGCPAAVANLWDVTDRDIDRFAQAVLKQWSGDSEGSSNSSSSDTSAGPASSSQRSASSAHSSSSSSSSSSRKKQDASSKQQSGSDTAAVASDQGVVSMCGAVAASRQACRLPSLIGAAAVCYGLPAFVSAPSLQ